MPTDEVVDTGAADGQVDSSAAEADVSNLGGDSAEADGGGAAGEAAEPTQSLGDGDAVTKAATESYRALFGGGNKPRDPTSGKFVKGPAGETKPAQPVADPAKVATQQTQPVKDPAAVAQQQIDPNRVPDSWTKDAKALWESLPPRVKAEVNKREADARSMMARTRQEAQATIGEHKNKTEFADSVSKAFEPQHFERYQAVGVDPRAVVIDATRFANRMNFGNNEQRVAMLRDLVKRFGIKIPNAGEQAAEGTEQPAQAQQPQFDPSQFRDPRLDPIIQQIEQSKRQAEERQQQEHQQMWLKVQSDIDDFAGNADNEHFVLVWDDMAKMLESGLAVDMNDAYNKAVSLNPTASAAAAAKTKAAETAKLSAEAAEARRAAGVRAGGKPSGFAPSGNAQQEQSPKNRRDSIVADKVRAFLGGSAA